MSRNGIRRQAVAVIFLQQDIATNSLKMRAISDVLAKTLYQNGNEPMSANRLGQKAAGLIKLDAIPASVVKEGLGGLKNAGWIEEISRGWHLTLSGKSKIEERHADSEKRLKRLVERYFGNFTEYDLLKNWFLTASIKFFSVHGDSISRALLQEEFVLPKRAELELILNDSIRDSSFEEYRNLLINGFHSFINDRDPEAGLQKMSFAQLRVSARLIAAVAGPDPLSVSHFENSKIFLDTNVLLLERIEAGSSESAQAIGALANALHSLGATLHIIRRTKEEYESVVERKRQATIKLLEGGAQISLLDKSGDRFIKAALKYEAKSKDDFANFYESIREAPSSIGSQEVELIEFPELETEISKAVSNKKRTTEIKEEFFKLRGWKKTDNLAEHDAALNTTALFYRKQEGKGWVVSRDKSMLNLSRRWHEKEGLPPWIFLDALVQTLAVGGAGPKYDPTEFAPLLGALVQSEVQDVFADFTLDDLGELLDIDTRVFELPEEEIVDFAQKVHQIQLSGSNSGVYANSEIPLAINRAFQKRRISDNKEAEKTRQELTKERIRSDINKKIGINTTANAVLPSLRSKERMKRWIPFVILGAVTLVSMYFLKDNQNLFISFGILFIGEVVFPILIMFFNPIDEKKLKAKALFIAEEGWKREQGSQA